MILKIVRPSPRTIRAKHREIARRYAWKLGQHAPLSFAAIRIAELARLYEHRYSGLALPDSDDGVQMARCMAHHMGRLRDAPRRISQWCDRHAPWLGLHEVERLIRDATECPLRWRADKIAWILRVTAMERTKCGLHTIGAIDQTRQERQKAAKERKRAKERQRRRQQGTKSRAEYEAKSMTKTAPWQTEGVSRATWYRKRRET